MNIGLLYTILCKTDISKSMFRSNESHIDMKSACQPIIAFRNKTIVDYYGKNSNNLL